MLNIKIIKFTSTILISYYKIIPASYLCKSSFDSGDNILKAALPSTFPPSTWVSVKYVIKALV